MYDLNKTAAQLAKKCCVEMTKKDPSKPRFAAGAVGPTNKTLSVSPSVENPAFRGCTYDEIVEAYYDQVEALIDGGVDVLLVETIFDTLNAKAAMFAIDMYFEKWGQKIPVFVSGTIVDNSGPHPVRPDQRGVLELHEPLQAHRHRSQLRARRQGHGPLHREPVQGGGLLGVLLPQRRSPQRHGRLRPEGPRDGGGLPRVPREGPDQRHRRLLRYHR